MLGADYVWPRKMFEVCRSELEGFGGNIVGERFMPLDKIEDYSALIRRIRHRKPSVLVMAAPGRIHVGFLKQARAAGLLASLTVGVLANMQTYSADFPVREDERMFACVPFVADDPATGVRQFVKDLTPFLASNVTLSSCTMTHYKSLIALNAALEGAGKVSREAAMEGLRACNIAPRQGSR